MKRKTTNIIDSARYVCRKCKGVGINAFIVSSIVTGKSSIFQTKINEENSVSKDLCVIIGFTIIGNASSNCDICDDLLHFIKYSGICKLANFVNVIKKVLDITNF